jgi:pimeloyl-ACP methyl ester carboxylesterase
LQTCPGLQPAAAPNPPAVRAWVRRCLASARRNPRHDTTTAAVRDLDQVRKALGYKKINLYGPSYGSRWAWPTCNAHSAHVRTAVFGSGSLINVPPTAPRLRPPALQPVQFHHKMRQLPHDPTSAPTYRGHHGSLPSRSWDLAEVGAPR